MLWTFIAVIAAGFAGAGIALLLRLVLRGHTPGWLMPLMAGGAMLAAAISMEYSWFDSQSANLADGLEVVATREQSVFYRPWTFLWPMTEGFIALDRQSVQAVPELPGIQLVNLHSFERWQATTAAVMAVDCDASAILPLPEIDNLTTTMLGPDAPWLPMREGDPVRAALCQT